jgi:hypothetical protein
MTMRRLATLLTLAVALLLTGAMGTTSALAASGIWEVEGNPITAGEGALSVEGESEFELADSKSGDGVLCKGILVGTVGPEGTDEIMEVLNAAKEKIGSLSGTALLCKSVKGCEEGADIEVWPGNLPWLTELLSMTEGEPEMLDAFFDSTTGSDPRWEITCLVIGIKVEDACEGNTSVKVENETEGFVLETFNPEGETKSEKGNCTIGGAETGVIKGEIPLLLTSGKQWRYLRNTKEGPHWLYNGPRLSGKTSFTYKNIGMTKIKTTGPTKALIECKKANNVGELIGSSPAKAEMTWKLEECKASKPSCAVVNSVGEPNEKITFKVNAELGYETMTAGTSEANPFVLVMKTLTKNEKKFVEINMETGTGCAKSPFNASGEEKGPWIEGIAGITCKFASYRSDITKHIIECTEPPVTKFWFWKSIGGTIEEGKSGLEYFGENAELIAEGEMEAVSKLNWGIMGA